MSDPRPDDTTPSTEAPPPVVTEPGDPIPSTDPAEATADPADEVEGDPEDGDDDGDDDGGDDDGEDGDGPEDGTEAA
jgi:hypothetical protein